jgi:hypothetical protein
MADSKVFPIYLKFELGSSPLLYDGFLHVVGVAANW